MFSMLLLDAFMYFSFAWYLDKVTCSTAYLPVFSTSW